MALFCKSLHSKSLYYVYKKVHCMTARNVPPAAYPVRGVWYRGGGGGVAPVLVLAEGPSVLGPDCGTTPLPPLKKNLGPEDGVPPGKDLGPEAGEGTWDQKLGYTPPPPLVGRQTEACKNITFPTSYLRGR